MTSARIEEEPRFGLPQVHPDPAIGPYAGPYAGPGRTIYIPVASRLFPAREPGPQVLYLNYRNPFEVWLELAKSAAIPGAIAASSVVLPRFADFVVKMGTFFRDYGAERRIKIAEARTAEAQADAARALADRAALGREEVEALGRLREALVKNLAETTTTGEERPALEAVTARRVSLEDSAAMLRGSDSPHGLRGRYRARAAVGVGACDGRTSRRRARNLLSSAHA